MKILYPESLYCEIHTRCGPALKTRLYTETQWDYASCKVTTVEMLVGIINFYKVAALFVLYIITRM